MPADYTTHTGTLTLVQFLLYSVMQVGDYINGSADVGRRTFSKLIMMY